ncbi:hypothetical protein GF359_09095 [candidate division WOR-3 bacterium]|uniref:Uncharacterized protein n=1 Tax=candidate division WOR-3 bacterium TaxID=2052148 RepID=A0A9D5QD84_UNCW3|nr:hypothetical protein [candidate division WOR-3 bacterium]MBD3365354.1 hypothetical protein [candidate division WOR-3 bacterium]
MKNKLMSKITGAELVAALEEMGFRLVKIEHREAFLTKGRQRVKVPLGVLSGNQKVEIRKRLRPILSAYPDSALPVNVISIKNWVNESIHTVKSGC